MTAHREGEDPVEPHAYPTNPSMIVTTSARSLRLRLGRSLALPVRGHGFGRETPQFALLRFCVFW